MNRTPRTFLFLAASLAVWIWTTLAHAFGTDLAYDYYQWARAAGPLAAEGGARGVRAAEGILTAVFLAVAAAGVWFALRRLRALSAEDRRERVLTWALWGGCVFLLWRGCIVFATEFVHFAQYGLIAGLLCAALRGERRGEVAFLAATGLGVLDEAWQHWGIAFAIEGNYWHGFDWSDLALNAAGACGGALVAAPAPDAGRPDVRRGRIVVAAAAALAAVLLPLRFADRVTLARIFGSHTYHPTWNEYDIGKPVHWMTPVDGVPLFVAAVLFLGLLVAGGRAFVTRGVALALLLLVTFSFDPPSRLEGRPVHEDVPTAQARRAASGRLVADGRLDEPEWADAQRIGPFVRNVPPVPGAADAGAGGDRLAGTWARVLWDDRALWVAFEVEDRDVWGRDAGRDDPRLPGDEVVEVFVDPDGDEVAYYELELSPLGAVYDLFNWIPEPPTDFNPSAPFLGLADWDARDVACGISVDGTADRVEDWASAAAPGEDRGEDRGWTAEIAIPWRVFRTTTTPSQHSSLRLPPEAGDRWRLGLFRVERPRTSPADGRPLSRREAEPLAQFQAWSPTLKASFHRPQHFGVLEFADGR